MAQSTDKLILEIAADNKKALKGINETNKKLSNLEIQEKKLERNNKSITERMKGHWVKLAAAIGGLVVGIKKAFDFTKEYSQYKQGMAALAKQTGMDADTIIKKLRAVSKATVSNKDLMLAANRAIALGVTKDVNVIAQLLEIARVKAKAMGTDTTSAFNDIVTGIGRQSPLILDNLGIITKGWAELAKQQGVNYDRQFILNQILKQGAADISKFGNALTEADRFEQLNAGVTNLRLKLGKLLSGVLAPFIKALIKMVDWFNNLSTPMQRLIILIPSLIGGIKLLSVALNTLSFNPLTLAITGAITVIYGLIQAWHSLTSTIDPNAVITTKEAFDKANKTYKDNKLQLERLNKELQRYKMFNDENSEAAKRLKDNIDKLNTFQKKLKANIDKYNKAVKDSKGNVIDFSNAQNDAANNTGKLNTNVSKLKATIMDYYQYVNDKQNIQLANEKEGLDKALEGYANYYGLKKSFIDDFYRYDAEKLAEKYNLTQTQYSMLTDLVMTYNMNTEAAIQESQDRLNLLHKTAIETYQQDYESLDATQKEYINRTVDNYINLNTELKNIIQQSVQQTADIYGQGIADLIVSGKKFHKSLADFFNDLLKKIATMIVKLLVVKTIMAGFNAVSGGFFGILGLSSGGFIQKFANGGRVRPVYAASGFEPKGTDTIPAMLTPGERVLSVSQNANFERLLSNLANTTTNTTTINNVYNITGEVIDDVALKDFTKKIMIEQEKILANKEAY